jgi:hypothetical protein
MARRNRCAVFDRATAIDLDEVRTRFCDKPFQPPQQPGMDTRKPFETVVFLAVQNEFAIFDRQLVFPFVPIKVRGADLVTHALQLPAELQGEDFGATPLRFLYDL